MPHLGLPHGPTHPQDFSAAKADRAQFKPKLLVRLAKVGGRHVPQGQKPRSGRAELQEGLRLSLPELTMEDTDGELGGGQLRPPLPALVSPCPSTLPDSHRRGQ